MSTWPMLNRILYDGASRTRLLELDERAAEVVLVVELRSALEVRLGFVELGVGVCDAGPSDAEARDQDESLS